MSTVGVIFSRKKIERSGLADINHVASQQGIRIVFLDLARPLEEQGPLDMIVHKISDIAAGAQQGIPFCMEQYERFTQYCQRHPHVVLIDPMANIQRVLDRLQMYTELEMCASVAKQGGQSLYLVPDTVALRSVTETDRLEIAFPAMCKRQAACAFGRSHLMTLVPDLSAMAKLEEHYGDDPVLLQSFVPHDGMVVKVYVLEKEIHVSVRPSFHNLDDDHLLHEAVHFDSQTLPKQFDSFPPSSESIPFATSTSSKKQSHPLPESVAQILQTTCSIEAKTQFEQQLDHERLQRIAESLCLHFGLTFFGFDVLVRSETQEYYVVDINYFPGFKDVPNVHATLVDIIKKRLGK